MVDAVRIDIISGPKDASEYTDAQLQNVFVRDMRSSPGMIETSAILFAKAMEDLERFSLWTRLGYDSMDAYIEDVLERPREWVDAVMTIAKEDAELGRDRKLGEVDKEAVALAREQAETVKSGTRTDIKDDAKPNDNIMRLDQGTSQSYTLRRLARERPDLLDQVEDGVLSPNAAAIKAGFRTRKVQVELSPEGVQRMLNRRMPEWRLVNVETGEFAEGGD